MRRTVAGLCALLMAIVPGGSNAASQPETDGRTVLSYTLRMLNAQSMLMKDIRSGQYPKEALPLMEELAALVTLEGLGDSLLPVIVAKVSADDLNACAGVLGNTKSQSALAAVPVGDDPVEALQRLAPKHQEQVNVILSQPCMTKVLAAIRSPAAQRATAAYGRSLGCIKFADDPDFMKALRRQGYCPRLSSKDSLDP